MKKLYYKKCVTLYIFLTIVLSGNLQQAYALDTEPTTQTSAMTATPAQQTVSLTFTAGNGTKTLIVYSTNSDFSTISPVDGKTYAPGSIMAPGYIVGFVGITTASTATTVVITGLTVNTTYYFAAYTFKDKVIGNLSGIGEENYLTTSPVTASATTINYTTAAMKSGVAGIWETATNWLVYNSNWRISGTIPASTTPTTISASFPLTITASSTASPYINPSGIYMEDNAVLALKPNGSTTTATPFEVLKSTTIDGNGGGIIIKPYTKSSTSGTCINYRPGITNVSSVTYDLNNAGGYWSSCWTTGFAPTNIPSGCQLNVTSAIGTIAGTTGFAVAYDGALMNTKLNLGDGVRLLRNGNPNNAAPYSTLLIGELAGSANSTIEGGFVSGASARVLQYYIGGLNTDATFNGKIKNYAATSPYDILNIFKKGTGKWTLTSASDAFYTGTFNVDEGTVIMNGVIASTAVSVTVATGAKLSGTGSFGGATSINGTLEGKLTFGSSLTLGSTSTTNLNVNAFTTGQFDKISVTGTLTRGGVLNITVSGAAPDENTSIQLITAGSYSGVFTTVNIPSGYSFDASTCTLTYTGNHTSGATSWTSGSFPVANAVVTVDNGVFTIDGSANVASITVAPDAMVTLNPGVNLTTSSLTLQSGSTGTATFVNSGTAAITSATVYQNLASGRNWYISSPVVAVPYTTLASATSVKYWDETAGVWAVKSTGSLDPGKGYVLVSATSTSNVIFSGVLNDGDITVNLTRTKDAYKSGFNLVGNPYPSYVSWDAVEKTNIDPTVWYRTMNSAGTYKFGTYNATSQIGTNVGTNDTDHKDIVTGNIPPMQAFWVRVLPATDGNSTTGTVLFKNTMRSHKGAQLQGDTQTYNDGLLRAKSVNTSQVLRLQVSNGANQDEAIVLINSNASNGLDSYDSQKMSNNSTSIPEIYTIVGNDALVINGLKSLENNTEIPLGFKTMSTGTFNIKLSQISNFDAGSQIILRDNLNGQSAIADLTNGNSYSFTSDSITINTRFSIVFKNSSAVTSLANFGMLDVRVSSNQLGQIIVTSNNRFVGNDNIRIYDSLGQLFESEPLKNKSSFCSNTYTHGIYVVSLTINGIIRTYKILLK